MPKLVASLLAAFAHLAQSPEQALALANDSNKDFWSSRGQPWLCVSECSGLLEQRASILSHPLYSAPCCTDVVWTCTRDGKLLADWLIACCSDDTAAKLCGGCAA